MIITDEMLDRMLRETMRALDVRVQAEDSGFAKLAYAGGITAISEMLHSLEKERLAQKVIG